MRSSGSGKSGGGRGNFRGAGNNRDQKQGQGQGRPSKPRPEERRYDVPHGTWRFTRPPAGFRATVVAGTPTWLDGDDTGARPGRLLRPVTT